MSGTSIIAKIFTSLKGNCTCSSESTLVKMPHCWKSHVQLIFVFFFHRFYRRFVIFILYFLLFVAAFILRPGTDPCPTIRQVNTTNGLLQNVTEIDSGYLLKACRTEDKVVQFHITYYMGLSMRKPVFGGSRTTQVQTSLRSLISASVICFLKSTIC